MAKDAKKRVQLDFSTSAFQRLEQLRDEIGETSIAEVIRLGLRLLDWYVVRKKEGWRLQLVRPDGTVADVLDLTMQPITADYQPRATVTRRGTTSQDAERGLANDEPVSSRFSDQRDPVGAHG